MGLKLISCVEHLAPNCWAFVPRCLFEHSAFKHSGWCHFDSLQQGFSSCRLCTLHSQLQNKHFTRIFQQETFSQGTFQPGRLIIFSRDFESLQQDFSSWWAVLTCTLTFTGAIVMNGLLYVYYSVKSDTIYYSVQPIYTGVKLSTHKEVTH